MASAQRKYLIISIDNFMMWMEAERLSTITYNIFRLEINHLSAGFTKVVYHQ